MEFSFVSRLKTRGIGDLQRENYSHNLLKCKLVGREWRHEVGVMACETWITLGMERISVSKDRRCTGTLKPLHLMERHWDLVPAGLNRASLPLAEMSLSLKLSEVVERYSYVFPAELRITPLPAVAPTLNVCGGNVHGLREVRTLQDMMHHLLHARPVCADNSKDPKGHAIDSLSSRGIQLIPHLIHK
jgi:hypothetical protein